ncbi:MAG: hypothetical protein G01um101429_366 [Parcubacteria group bacterium Gr01-1014_29]|nr:MAG: hypothetical protein G01um101429_366 [Parcubacteria group bacterium Gr01-1014_29]
MDHSQIVVMTSCEAMREIIDSEISFVLKLLFSLPIVTMVLLYCVWRQ